MMALWAREVSRFDVGRHDGYIVGRRRRPNVVFVCVTYVFVTSISTLLPIRYLGGFCNEKDVIKI